MPSRATAFISRLLRRAGSDPHRSVRGPVWDLLGAGRETFTALGGGEHWLRQERALFYGGYDVSDVNDEADPAS